MILRRTQTRSTIIQFGIRNSHAQYSVSQCHPIYSVVFLAKGKTPTDVGLSGKWTKTDWNICTQDRLVFDIANGTTGTSGANVQIYSYNDSKAQKFWFYTKNFGDVNMWVRTAQHSVSQASLYSGNTTFSGALNIGVISDNYKRIELSITIDNVVTTHFINNPTTGVDYAIPLIYIPSKTELRRIAFTKISFTSDGHTYLSKFTFVDNFGSISTLDNIKAKIDIVGYKQNSVSQDNDWLTLNQFIKYKKTGNIVTVVGEADGGFGFGGNDKYGIVGTLPSEYRPSINVPVVFHAMGGTSYNKSGYIDKTGEIRLYDRNSYVSYWGFCVSYPIQHSVSHDYIVAQGTSGIWFYRKWNSGLAEFWGGKQLSGKGSVTAPAVDFPFALTSLLYKSASAIYSSGSKGVFILSGSGASSNALTHTGVYVLKQDITDDGTTTVASIEYNVKGLWK